MTKRLFVALSPSTECRELVALARETLKARFPDMRIRWQPDSNVHLTLSFLGNVAEELLEDCQERLTACGERAQRFDLCTTRLGAFPSPLRPSVIWLGIDADPADALSSLQRDVASAYRHIREERRPFRPHITLGRVKDVGSSNRAAIAAVLTELPASSTCWRCDQVTLFESTLAPEGAVHTPLHRVAIPQ
jgi:2'-5' RNA ligase